MSFLWTEVRAVVAAVVVFGIAKLAGADWPEWWAWALLGAGSAILADVLWRMRGA